MTFDPFLYLSLPLPALQSWVTIMCFPRNGSVQPVKVIICCYCCCCCWIVMKIMASICRQLSVLMNENSRAMHLKEEIRKQMTGWSDSQVQLMEWHNGTIRRILTDHTYLSSLHNLDALVAFQTLTPSPSWPTIDIPIIQVRIRSLPDPCGRR